MNKTNSLIKARYCRSIMKTAASASELQARQLIAGLSSEVPTPDIADDLANVELSAFTAIDRLFKALDRRGHPTIFAEWNSAEHAVSRWVQLAS